MPSWIAFDAKTGNGFIPRTGEFVGRDIDDFMVREEWV